MGAAAGSGSDPRLLPAGKCVWLCRVLFCRLWIAVKSGPSCAAAAAALRDVGGARRHWCVYSDYRQAYRLGLAELAEGGAGRVTVVTLTDTASTLSVRQGDVAAAAPPGSGLEPEVLGIESDQHLEAEGYRLIMELASQGRLAKRLFVTNDLIAKGASRAVLALRCDGKPAPSRLVVVAGIQQVVPLGIPVTYVGQDIRDEARQAVNILMGAMGDDLDAPTRAQTRFHLWRDAGDGQGAPDSTNPAEMAGEAR